MFLPMLALLAADGPAWYGPVTVTFPVQFAGDPFDRTRNDVRVRFLGERAEREERPAVFDPILGAWRATLYAHQGGRYRAILFRRGQDGKEKDALVEPTEGIVELRATDGLGVVQASPDRSDRLALDTGGPWVGLGTDLGATATADRIDALARAGANWVRLASADDPLDPDALDTFGEAMAAAARDGVRVTPRGARLGLRRLAGLPPRAVRRLPRRRRVGSPRRYAGPPPPCDRRHVDPLERAVRRPSRSLRRRRGRRGPPQGAAYPLRRERLGALEHAAPPGGARARGEWRRATA